MTSQAFEAVLSELDSNASRARLHELICTQSFTKLVTSTIAGDYLQAFCDTTSSHIRRRWIGIALARMIEGSLDAVEYLKGKHQELTGLGNIILSGTEREETKIVAGIIIRQALQQGIKYSHFWGTEKVQNSAPNFPSNFSPRWMNEFQSFLDTLGDLALLQPAADPSILYAISVTASDGFKWRDSTEELLVVIVQAGLLTIVALGSSLEEVQFMDIPVAHIVSMRTQRSSLYDSQARSMDHEPWDLILALEAMAWTYRLNTSSHEGDEVTLLFEHSQDAKELESCIKEHRKEKGSSAIAPNKIHPGMSASSPIHVGPLLLTEPNKALKQHGRQILSQPNLPAVSSDDPLQASPLQSSTKPNRLRKDTRNDDPITKKSEGSPSIRTNHKYKVTQKSANVDCESISKEPRSSKQPESTTSKSRGTQHSQGKLKKVSQETKLKASQQLCAESDIFDIDAGSPDPETNEGTKVGASSVKPSHKQPKNSKVLKQEVNGGKKGSKPRSKRKADEDNDDEFVPDERKSKKPKTNTRKQKSETVSNPPTLRAKTRSHPQREVSSRKEGSKSTKGKNVSEQPQHKAEISKMHAHPVIDGLLATQKPVLSPQVHSEMQRLPDHASSPSPMPLCSTPQLIETPIQPQTPKEIRKRPTSGEAIYIFSSPPLGTAIKGSLVAKVRNRNGTEILSSNSKPVPASPTAESTAISGHADRDDIDQEKKEAESQTAKSDPFKQKGSSQNATSFTRRLTGDHPTNGLNVNEVDRQDCLPDELPLKFPNVDDILSDRWSDPSPQRAPVWKENPRPVASGFNEQNLNCSQSPSKQPMRIMAMRQDVVSIAGESRLLQETIAKQGFPLQMRSLGINTQRHLENKVSPNFNAEDRLTQKDVLVERIPGLPEQHDVKTSNSISITNQQTNESTRVTEPVQEHHEVDWDGDTTIVGHIENKRAVVDDDPLPIHFRSSPPGSDTPSSRSSTSNESSAPSSSPVPTSEAEEMEWEASLQPHQRSIHDLLVRVSKRVMRHIVDNETAIMDIADIYAEDGVHLLDVFLEQNSSGMNHFFQDMEIKTKRLRKELVSAAREVAKERNLVSAMI